MGVFRVGLFKVLAISSLAGSSCGYLHDQFYQRPFDKPASEALNLTYPLDRAVYVFNDMNSSLTENIAVLSPTTIGAITNFSISPNLSANSGLLFDEATGKIAGKPTLTSPETTYTVTATSGSQSVQKTIKIRTHPGFAVNDLGSDVDSTTADSKCSTASGLCTLKAAVTQINSMSTSVMRVVALPIGAITLDSTVTISNNLEIVGGGTEVSYIDGALSSAFNMFIVASATSGAKFSHLTFRNSRAIAVAIGIAKDLYLHKIRVDNVQDTAAFAAIKSTNGSNLYVTESVFTNSTGSNLANCITCVGAGTCSISNSVFKNNSGTAAPIYAGSSTILISGSEFSDNVVSGGYTTAGAIDIRNSSTISNCTFTSTTNSGSGPLAVISNNTAGTMNLVSTTIYGNILGTSSALRSTSGPINIKNSIVANNANVAGGVLRNCSNPGFINSQGYNLSDTNTSDCPFTHPTDRPSSAAALGILQENGGPTRTMAPQNGSAAINGGPTSATCVATLGVANDQRGSPRPGNATKTNCDIGAHETQ